ncbi:MAG: DUF357 domain-containing protein [Candidatus Diapherotrites archaeon]
MTSSLKEIDWKTEIEKRASRYRSVTQKALKKISIVAKKNTKEYTIAMDYLTMANNYFNDAIHFQNKGDFILAMAAFSYAHAWLDAGVRAGIFDGMGDDQLFTLP